MEYEREEAFLAFDVPRRKLNRRYAILENKVNRLPFWRKHGLQRLLPGEYDKSH